MMILTNAVKGWYNVVKGERHELARMGGGRDRMYRRA